MIEVNAMGDACPIPVVKTLNAMKKLNGAGAVQTLVDNKTAVENLTRLAESKGCAIETEQLGEKEYRVTITVGEGEDEAQNNHNAKNTHCITSFLIRKIEHQKEIDDR